MIDNTQQQRHEREAEEEDRGCDERGGAQGGVRIGEGEGDEQAGETGEELSGEDRAPDAPLVGAHQRCLPFDATRLGAAFALGFDRGRGAGVSTATRNGTRAVPPNMK